VVLAVFVALVATAIAAATPRSPFPGNKIDLQSASPLVAEPDSVSAAGIGGPVNATGSPPRVGDNVFANATQSGPPAGLVGRSETTLSLHGQNLLAGWNDAEGFCGVPYLSTACANPALPPGLSGYAFSTDGGQNWTDGGAPPTLGTGIITRGDPWMDNNGSGTFYYANLAVDGSGASLGVSVHRGHFSGGSFVWDDVKAFDAPANATSPESDFYDKEALVSGKNANRNDAYVSLTNFQELCGNPQFGFGQIEVWRTHDGGASWQGPAIAGPEAPDSVADCGNSGTLQQSSAPAVGPKGEVYVAWQYGPTFLSTGAITDDADIVIAKSTDGGATFAPTVKVADIYTSRNNPPIGYNRARVNDHPRVDVALTGKNKGRVYVTYYSSVASVGNPPATTQVLIDIQTYLTWSDDGGATWSSPVEIGGPIPAKPADVGAIKRWWPDVTVGPGGEVHVVYLEERATQLTANPSDTECIRTIDGGTRVGPYSSLVDTWWTYSKDGGASFSMPLKLSSGTSFWCTPSGNPISNIRPNMGDYIDAQAGPGLKVYGLWADGRDSGPYPPFGAGNFLMAGSAFGVGKS
jgi:hypothetical protein